MVACRRDRPRGPRAVAGGGETRPRAVDEDVLTVTRDAPLRTCRQTAVRNVLHMRSWRQGGRGRVPPDVKSRNSRRSGRCSPQAEPANNRGARRRGGGCGARGGRKGAGGRRPRTWPWNWRQGVGALRGRGQVADRNSTTVWRFVMVASTVLHEINSKFNFRRAFCHIQIRVRCLKIVLKNAKFHCAFFKSGPVF